MKKFLRTIEVYIPDNDRLLIKQFPGDEKSPGGIIIPDTAKEKPQKGTIIGKGPDVKNRWEIGMRIYFGKYAGSEMIFNGVTFVVIRENDLSGELLAFENQDPEDWDLEMMRPKSKEVTSKKKK